MTNYVVDPQQITIVRASAGLELGERFVKMARDAGAYFRFTTNPKFVTGHFNYGVETVL